MLPSSRPWLLRRKKQVHVYRIITYMTFPSNRIRPNSCLLAVVWEWIPNGRIQEKIGTYNKLMRENQKIGHAYTARIQSLIRVLWELHSPGTYKLNLKIEDSIELKLKTGVREDTSIQGCHLICRNSVPEPPTDIWNHRYEWTPNPVFWTL